MVSTVTSWKVRIVDANNAALGHQLSFMSVRKSLKTFFKTLMYAVNNILGAGKSTQPYGANSERCSIKTHLLAWIRSVASSLEAAPPLFFSDSTHPAPVFCLCNFIWIRRFLLSHLTRSHHSGPEPITSVLPSAHLSA